ncbi:hypothetical protein [Yeosuana marina]|uniref:hypothetical protein n=1 Tax=Yeosuana marina TaxID=1565536 RepID=UPI00141EC922|nr:hypothetical protein [Yeosuana marina]
MKIRFLSLFLLLTISSCGQNKIKTFDKTLIPGTRVYLDKPENFKLAANFIGLKSGESVIQFFDLFGGNYNSNAKSFTKENFEKKGVTVFDFKKLKIDGFPAKLAFLQGNPNQKSLQLVFGDNEFSVMVMAFIPDFEKEKIKQIENSFLTIEYDKNRVVDPFEIAFFKIDDSKSSYKYSKTVSNMFLYTKNGIKKDSFMGESAYLISQLPTERPDMGPKSLFDTNLNSLKSNGLIISKRIPTERKKLNGFNCYEELIIGNLNNEETQIIMTCVVKENRAVIIAGLVKDDFESTVEEFKKLTNELKMK